MTTERDFESAKPSIISSWTGSERSWKKSLRADCRGPSAALQRDPSPEGVCVEHPIALKMGKEVESWFFYRVARGTIIGCLLEDAAHDHFNRNGEIDHWIKHYGRKRTDVFYVVRFVNDLWHVLPEADIKVIAEDSRERYAISQHAGLPGRFLDHYQHDLTLKTADGVPAKLGCRVTTKRLGLPVTARLVGVMSRHSGVHESWCKDEDLVWQIKQWDRTYPNWRDDDLCLLRVDGGQNFMSRGEFWEAAEDAIGSSNDEELAARVNELGMESIDDQLREQLLDAYKSLSGDEYRYWYVPVADVEVLP